jgi:hypothetical protein
LGADLKNLRPTPLSAGRSYAVPFDVRPLQAIGGPVPVVEGVARTSAGLHHFAISDSGSLMFLPGPADANHARVDLALLDRRGHGRAAEVPPAWLPGPSLFAELQLAVGTEDGKDANIWIYDRAGSSAIRQLTLEGKNRFPIWTPDGVRAAFQSDREGDLGIFWQRADGSGTASRLTKPDQGQAHIPHLLISTRPPGKRLQCAVPCSGNNEGGRRWLQ